MARIFNITFNARDPIALGRFWSAALRLRIVSEEPELVRLASDDARPDLLILRAAAPAASSVVHLDRAATDVRGEVDRLVAMGACLIDVGADGQPRVRSANGIDWYVLTDPEGNEFCVGGEP